MSGARYDLANTFMMAWPYGWKQVMSGYRFENMSTYETDKGHRAAHLARTASGTANSAYRPS